MGMSASQARYIQLTARMSDLELEGQQINQQRLNLSNQAASLSEQALRIPVPTAPSPYDFMKETYTGKTSDGKGVKLSLNGDGKLEVAVEGNNVNSLKARVGDDATTNDVKAVYEKEATPNPQGTIIEATVPKQKEVKCYENNQGQISEEDFNNKIANKYTKEQYKTQKQTDANNAYLAYQSALQSVPTEPDESDFMNDGELDSTAYNSAKTAYNTAKSNADTKKTAYETAKSEYESAEDDWETSRNDVDSYKESVYYDGFEGTENVKIEKGGNPSPQITYHKTGLNGTGDAPAMEYTWTSQIDGSEQKGDLTAVQKASNGCSKSQMEAIKNSYFTSDGKAITEENFDPETGLCKVDLYKKTNNVEVDGNSAYTLDDSKVTSADGGAELKSRIKNYVASQNNGILNADELSKWRIVVSNGIATEAIKIENGTATRYQNEQVDEGWISLENPINVSDIKNFNNATGTGNITVNGKKVMVTKGQEKDDVAYGAAVAKYENEKAEYDRVQEDFNQKTKKLQEQDKQLELKLKRLDTERNALNTEIDAVKKVIQDNTDKSFKTFSG